MPGGSLRWQPAPLFFLGDSPPSAARRWGWGLACSRNSCSGRRARLECGSRCTRTFMETCCWRAAAGGLGRRGQRAEPDTQRGAGGGAPRRRQAGRKAGLGWADAAGQPALGLTGRGCWGWGCGGPSPGPGASAPPASEFGGECFQGAECVYALRRGPLGSERASSLWHPTRAHCGLRQLWLRF